MRLLKPQADGLFLAKDGAVDTISSLVLRGIQMIVAHLTPQNHLGSLDFRKQ